MIYDEEKAEKQTSAREFMAMDMHKITFISYRQFCDDYLGNLASVLSASYVDI
jgi:hypothetical protein